MCVIIAPFPPKHFREETSALSCGTVSGSGLKLFSLGFGASVFLNEDLEEKET